MRGDGCFDPFMCGGDHRWSGVRIFQVWVGVKVSSLSCPQLFQLSKKFLEVGLLGRGGGYFRGHSNGINGRAGCWNIGVGIG